MAKKLCQTYLSDKSMSAVEVLRDKYVAVGLSESSAINLLVESTLIAAKDIRKANSDRRKLAAENLELKSELGFLQDSARDEAAGEGV
jgi:hypothetical protein